MINYTIPIFTIEEYIYFCKNKYKQTNQLTHFECPEEMSYTAFRNIKKEASKKQELYIDKIFEYCPYIIEINRDNLEFFCYNYRYRNLSKNDYYVFYKNFINIKPKITIKEYINLCEQEYINDKKIPFLRWFKKPNEMSHSEYCGIIDKYKKDEKTMLHNIENNYPELLEQGMVNYSIGCYSNEWHYPPYEVEWKSGNENRYKLKKEYSRFKIFSLDEYIKECKNQYLETGEFPCFEIPPAIGWEEFYNIKKKYRNNPTTYIINLLDKYPDIIYKSLEERNKKAI